MQHRSFSRCHHMSFKHWVGSCRRRFSRSRQSKRPFRDSYRGFHRPVVELLEDRTLLSANLDQLFVERAYADLLVKAPDAATEQSLIDQLLQGTSRLAVVQGIEQSTGYWTVKVREAYETFLRREPRAAGLQFWVG